MSSSKGLRWHHPSSFAAYSIYLSSGLVPFLMWEVLLYMCCVYWLMNKEAAFSQWLNKIQSGWKRYVQTVEGIRKTPGRYHVASRGERRELPAGTLPVSHKPHG